MKKSIPRKSQNLVRLHSERGASLLEGIAYLGIAAIVILGAVSLLTSAFGSAQANQTAQEIVSIRTAVKRLYMGQASSYGTADITARLISARAFPTTLSPNTAGTAVSNAWNGTVTVAGTNSGSTFTITYSGVPQDVCISIVSGATGWTQIDQGGQNAITAFPATPAAASTVCNVTSSAGNSISFTSA